jgi:type IV secretory pathway VirB9-like protein
MDPRWRLEGSPTLTALVAQLRQCGVVMGFALLALAFVGLLLVGCAHEEPAPPVPPAPEDLSVWSVPELVQPPPPETPCPQGPTGPQGPQPPQGTPTAAEKIYDFAPGNTYQAPVAVGSPLDIVLERGEEIRNYSGGDPELRGEGQQAHRWEVKIGASGTDATMVQHVFLRATEAKLKMGLTILTTKRIYYLTCESLKVSPIRAVRWHYPFEPPSAAPPKEPGLLPDPQEPRHYHVGYEFAASKPAPHWQPRQVVDDGKKTYILFPEVTLFETVPMVRLIGPNGPQLVNSRQYLNVLILDQLLPRGELRVGIGDHAETVTITRGQMQTIACPGDASCPVWPAAAQVVAREAVQP